VHAFRKLGTFVAFLNAPWGWAVGMLVWLGAKCLAIAPAYLKPNRMVH